MKHGVLLMALALLFACDNRSARQKAALHELDAAETAWAAGNYAQAFARLDIIILTYGDMPAASRALALHAAYLQAYRRYFDPRADWKILLNGCGVAAAIYDELVSDAITSKKPYPDDLTALPMYREVPELVQACHYEKGLFHAGFLLDCRAANTLAHKNEQYAQWRTTTSGWMLGNHHARCNAQSLAVDEDSGRVKITHPPAMPDIAPLP